MSKYLFRYKFVQGKEIKYKIGINGGLDIVTPSGIIANPIKMEMRVSQKIIACEDDCAVVSVTVDSVTAADDMPKERLPEVGASSVMNLDSLGNVTWINGHAAWDGAEHSVMTFPEYEIQPGDSWTVKTNDRVGSAAPIYTKYRLNGYDRKKNHLMVFSTEVFSGTLQENDYKNIGKGTFSFNSDDSWVEESGIYVKYSCFIPLPDNPAAKIQAITGLRIDMERL